MVALEDSDFAVLGDSIDLNQVAPLPVANTVAYVKQATLLMVQHLNRFSVIADEKLRQMSTAISRLETELTILESKLASIPGLENIKAAVPIATSSGVGEVVPPASTVLPPNAPQAVAYSIPPTAPMPLTVTVNESNPALTTPPVFPTSVSAAPDSPVAQIVADAGSTVVTVQEDPIYAKYFRMQRMGVPAQAVKLKMQSEGLNPNLLDTPTAPSPSGGAPPKTADSSASDASDSDDSD
ncbi:putative WASH complex subunit CCDC53 [Hypsibius exemplaris]|uniref:WASH complex subunit CCDC53 n=1 Tax=Hypsibius exemplaris TaxID=2072580 RepID=A0A1W0WHN7_HYPEX|nr:putative WASH complex subunit CCDC53 [Hypsibius exemplaris]